MAHNLSSHVPNQSFLSGGGGANQSFPIPKSSQQLKCETDGGTWDPNSGTCILPSPKVKPKKEEPPEVLPDVPEVGDIQETSLGKVTLPDGREFTGLNLDDIQQLVSGEAGQEARLLGTEPEGSAQARADLQRQRLQEAGGLGQLVPDIFANAAAGDVAYLSALASAIPGIIPDLATGFATGAVVGGAGGTVVLPGVGTVAGAVGVGTLGAVANAVRGFYSDFVSDVASQKGDYIQSSITELSERKGALGDLISAVNGGADKSLASKNFRNQLSLIERDRIELTAESNSNLNKFLGQNTIDELKEYDAFYSEGGERESFITEMFLAITEPNPSRIDMTKEQEDLLKKVVRDSFKTISNVTPKSL